MVVSLLDAQSCRNGGGGGAAPALLTRGRGARGAVLPLAFHWNSNEVKRLLCSIAKVSVVSVSLLFSAVISVLVGLDCSFEDS